MTTPAPIVDSRLRNGVLTLDGTSFASQATNVRLEPSTGTEGDPLEVLSGATIAPDDTTTWQLVIVNVQDFDEADGFQAFALGNAGDLVPFVWRPNPTVEFTGTVRVRPVPIGGDVNARLTVQAEWPLDGAPTPNYSPAP